MELQRLLCKKVVIIGILIYLLQAMLFLIIQTENVGLGELTNQNKKYNALLEELKHLPFEESIIKIENLQKGKDDVVIQELKSKLTYLSNYQTKIDAVIYNADKVKEFSVFQDIKSFSYINVLKTAKDFGRLDGIDLTLDKDRATEHVVVYSYLNFFVIGFVGYVLFEMLKERTNGMWEIIHTMKNGRTYLGMRREMSLVIITIGYYLLCFLTDLILSCLIYGKDDFGGFIQTIQLYGNYTFPISKTKYLCIFVIHNSIALVALVILLYFIFTIIRSKNIATVLSLVLFTLEWQLEQKIPMQSNFRIIKYVNIMKLFNCSILDREYQNLDILGRAVSTTNVMLFCEIILIAVGSSFILILYANQYPGKSLLFKSIIKYFEIRGQQCLEKLPWVFQEIYKVLICKKMLGVLFFVFVACNWILQKTEIVYPELQQDMDAIYRLYGGEDCKRFDAYINELEKKCEQNLVEADKLAKKIREESIDAERISEVFFLQNQAAGLMSMLKEFNEKQQLRDKVKAKQGIEIYMMSDRGYSEIIGPNSMIYEVFSTVIMIAYFTILTAHVWEFEYQSHLIPLLNSSEKGIVWVWKRKIYCIVVMTIAAFGFMYGNFLFKLVQEYQVSYLEAPVQSLTFYSNCVLNISILQAIVLKGIFKFIILLFVVIFTTYIASCKKMINQLYIPLIIVLFSMVYIFHQITWKMDIFVYSSIIMGCCIPFLIYSSYKKWCTK